MRGRCLLPSTGYGKQSQIEGRPPSPSREERDLMDKGSKGEAELGGSVLAPVLHVLKLSTKGVAPDL